MFSSERKFDPFTLVIGIIFAAMSVIVARNPVGSLKTLIFIIAFALVFEGVFKLFDVTMIDKALGLNPTWLIISAVLDIVLGGLIFAKPELGAAYIWIMLALWFIFDSLFELWISRYVRQESKGYFWFNVILGVIGVFLGIVLLLNPGMAVGVGLFLLSFYFMFFGILLIVRSF
ncbi:HdeD family acid-resistance protein [Fructilactobacillus frigidiflavus]|uniref:HdeD family acid-resistance protein n=1 Tax=Fructilactobacillus frigidiflavus TaxID=3242688 RepID=UPI003757F956